MPKNEHVPAKINQRRGPKLPCSQFKPTLWTERLAEELMTEAWIPGEELNFHTTAPWDISLHQSHAHNVARFKPPLSI